MCSRLQGEKTPRYLRKCLLHRFRCHRHFLFQKDSSPFIQNAVTRRAISKIHTDRQPLLLENFTLEYLHSANLLHSRSPFLCASSTSIIGSVSHPAGDRPSHLNLISFDCVFDASLVPETCLDRFVDLKGHTQQVSGVA